MSEYQIKSKNFLPENLRSFELFPKLCEVLDYVLDAYHTKNIDIIKAMYDIKKAEFDYERTLKLLGSEYFLDFNINSEQFKVLCLLLSNLYEIKGTKKGLKYLLHMLDMDCNVHEWYDINQWYQQGVPGWNEEVPKCSIVLELKVNHQAIGICSRFDKWALPRTGAPGESDLSADLAFEDTEGKFRDFAEKLLWVCVFLQEIRWAKIISDFVDTSDDLQVSYLQKFYTKYSPYVTNCPGTIQVGNPVFPVYPFVGDPVKVGDERYDRSPFFVRSEAEYNDNLDYDGWENIGVVGASTKQITLPIIGSVGLTVGQTVYYDLPDYITPAWFYVGQLYKEVRVSSSTDLVSGCEVSFIRSHKEVELSDKYIIRRGVLVGVEDSVTGGDSYLVDDVRGDYIVGNTDVYYSEQISEFSEYSIQKGISLSSDYKELFRPVTVGDPLRFVGDSDTRVGTEHYFSLTEYQIDAGLKEQFYTNCIQVNSFGHSFIAGNPAEYLPQHLPLSVGTYLYIGGGEFVDPNISIYGGHNLVGETFPWDGSSWAGDSRNIIYAWLETHSETEIQTQVPETLDNTVTLLSEALSSSIYDTLWTQLVGGNVNIGAVVYFQVGTGDNIGNAPPVGYFTFSGDSFVSEDPYCKLDVHQEQFIIDSVIFNVPVVGMSYAGDTPLGYVGADSLGRIYTGKELILNSHISEIQTETLFTNEVEHVDDLESDLTQEDIADSIYESLWTQYVGEQRFVGDSLVSEDPYCKLDIHQVNHTIDNVLINVVRAGEGSFVGNPPYLTPIYVGFDSVGRVPNESSIIVTNYIPFIDKEIELVTIVEPVSVLESDMYLDTFVGVSEERYDEFEPILTQCVDDWVPFLGDTLDNPEMDVTFEQRVHTRSVLHSEHPIEFSETQIIPGETSSSVTNVDTFEEIVSYEENFEPPQQRIALEDYVFANRNLVGDRYANYITFVGGYTLIDGSSEIGYGFVGDTYSDLQVGGYEVIGSTSNVGEGYVGEVAGNVFVGFTKNSVHPWNTVSEDEISKLTASDTEITGTVSLVRPNYPVVGAWVEFEEIHLDYNLVGEEGVTVSDNPFPPVGYYEEITPQSLSKYFVGGTNLHVGQSTSYIEHPSVGSWIGFEQTNKDYLLVGEENVIVSDLTTVGHFEEIQTNPFPELFVGDINLFIGHYTQNPPPASVKVNSNLTCWIEEDGIDDLFSFSNSISVFSNLHSSLTFTVEDGYAYPSSDNVQFDMLKGIDEQFLFNEYEDPAFVLSEDGHILIHPIDEYGTILYVLGESKEFIFDWYPTSNPNNIINAALHSETKYETSEYFNVNIDMMPVVSADEEENIFIFNSTDGINPIYLVYEQFEPYEYNPVFNPFNIINAALCVQVRQEYSEQFNVNEDPISVMAADEENNVLIYHNTEGINPDYIAFEQQEPYTFDPLYNFTNALHGSLFYTVDES